MKKGREGFWRVHKNKSELVHPDGRVEVFEEGPQDENAQARHARIKEALSAGFLDTLITDAKASFGDNELLAIKEPDAALINTLVSSVTSEVGRALVGLLVLQLVVKTIEPTQSIRLHKGGKSSSNFSWKAGISMRTLDKAHITPRLRAHGLLKLNADGFMMTRSLAENYPYSPLYKANLKGGRKEWLALVEEIEGGRLDPRHALKYLIFRLINSANEFEALAERVLKALNAVLQTHPSLTRLNVTAILEQHARSSGYAARLMEIAMHSLFQALKDTGIFPGFQLIPLSQMRSANKKHGNVGDVEFAKDDAIVVAWDAKYGKPSLKGELEELADKMRNHRSLSLAGFVTNEEPQKNKEIEKRIQELSSLYGVDVRIVSFSDWVAEYYKIAHAAGVGESQLSKAWLVAYTESLAQKRRRIAPIDEPCYMWLKSLLVVLGQL